jgi:hypothetical protein
MAFLKELLLPNGVTAYYHRIVGIQTAADMTELEVRIGSWADSDQYLQEKAAIWNHYIKVPIDDLYTKTEDVLQFMEPLLGSTRAPDATGLYSSQVKKWWEIKIKRDQVEFGGFVWDGSSFDSDSQSQSRIQGAVQLALLAAQANQPFSITWTLQDNSARVLNGQEMIEVGLALAQHVQTTHETARLLRAQIDSSTTVQQLAAIIWPIA